MVSFLVHYDFWIDFVASMLGLVLYVGSTYTLQQRRHPAAALSWLLMFAFLPLVAIPAFLVFGQRKIKANTDKLAPPWPIQSRSSIGANRAAESRGWMSEMLVSLGGAPVRDARRVEVHKHGAQAEAALWQSIAEARERIWVSTYVLGNDRIGNELIHRLAQKAQHGVDVRLLLDGVGCFFVRYQQLSALTSAGGQVARAFPPLRRMLQRQSNFRNHRKMLLADGDCLWMGGRNFADEYFQGKSPLAAWPDLSLTAYGALAQDAEAVFSLDWYWASGERLRPTEPRKPSGSGSNDSNADPDSQQVQLLASGPDQTQDSLQSFIVTACFRAQNRIMAVTPYLIPDPTLTQALSLAARRGVAVDIVLPQRSNHILADLARNRAMRELALAGVNIWLSPEMMHAKALVFDELAMTGSANLDIRSLFLNFELAVVLYDKRPVAQLAHWISQYQHSARRYSPTPASLPRDILEGAVLWVGFQL
jgi:cardiolipin synthase A/B